MSKMVQIQTPPCPCCGGIKFLEVEEEHLKLYRSKRPLIQECFPELSAENREMLISGICPKCWSEMFDFDDEDEDE